MVVAAAVLYCFRSERCYWQFNAGVDMLDGLSVGALDTIYSASNNGDAVNHVRSATI